MHTLNEYTRNWSFDCLTLQLLSKGLFISLSLTTCVADVDSCLDSTDSITVYDGRNTQSHIIAQLCNNNRFVNVISTGPDLYIEFVAGLSASSPSFSSSSSSSSPTHSSSSSSSSRVNFAQGFQAKYHFYSGSETITTSENSHVDTTNGGSGSFRRGSKPSEGSSRETAIQVPGTGKKRHRVSCRHT